MKFDLNCICYRENQTVLFNQTADSPAENLDFHGQIIDFQTLARVFRLLESIFRSLARVFHSLKCVFQKLKHVFHTLERAFLTLKHVFHTLECIFHFQPPFFKHETAIFTH